MSEVVNKSPPRPTKGAAEEQFGALRERPIQLIPYGRGKQGKTTFLRWAAERAHQAGRQVLLGDADRTNRTLSHFFEKVSSPASASDAALQKWMDELCTSQASNRFSACIDVGGGDRLVKKLVREVELLHILEKEDISLVMAYFVGGSADDIAAIGELESAFGDKKPAAFVIYNEAQTPSDMEPYEFVEKVLAPNEALGRLLGRGVKLVHMPRLEPAPEIERLRLLFSNASKGITTKGGAPLTLFARQMVNIWLRKMEESFKEVSELLP